MNVDVRHYRDEGYLILRSLMDRALIERAFGEASELYRRSDLISANNLRCRFQTNPLTQESQFECFDPIIDLSPTAGVLAASRALIDVLAALYGEPACLFKDKLIYKPPGCPGYPLHQDWIGWPGFPKSFLSVLVPLEPSTLSNGCTIVYPGYHRRGPLSIVDGRYHEVPSDTVNEAEAVPLELEPGDVAIFGGFMPHGSATNHSNGWRRQLYLSYNRLSEGGRQRAAHYEEFHRWLRGRHAEQSNGNLYFE